MAVMQPPQPTAYRFTRQQFYRLAELGWFQDQRVELIEGEVIEMPPPGNPHCVSTECSAEALRQAFGKGYWVRVQMPLICSPYSDPQPDIAIVTGSPRDYTDHPTTALLVIEVSDTTLSYDRWRKASLYALAGITDYWIININDRQLEIHRRPGPDSSQYYGYGFADVTVLSETDDALPQVRLLVADLLP